jgi:filamentous hemagglutinin
VTSGTNINQVASVSGKDITLAAGRDVTANAAVVAATGDVKLAAGRNVSLGTVNENFRQQISWANDSGASNWVGTLTGPNLVDQSNGAHGISESGVNRATLTGSKDVSTQVSGNNISIRAGQDVVTKGTQIVAEGALSATAGRDVRIETANESGSARDEHQHSSGGLLTATSVKTDDSSSYSRNVGSTFSGNTVAVRAGNDVNITGSDVVSTQGTALAAGNNVNIVAATDSSTQRNFRRETKSGVMGAGFGVGPTDPTAVAKNATNMPNISSGSQAKVVANNPYIPKTAGGTFSMMDYLPEAARITQRGGEIVVNENMANKYFANMPTPAELDAMGLTIKYQGSILPEYQGMKFFTTEGRPIEIKTMRTIVFVKKGA